MRGLSASPQAFGGAGAGVMRGSGYPSIDLTLGKKLHLTEQHSLRLRTELFNTFNVANFFRPDICAEDAGSGRILTAAQARTIEFALKY